MRTRAGIAVAIWLTALAVPTTATVVPLDHGFLGNTVDARLAGRPVRLIVDTGSTDTVIDSRRRDLATHVTERGRGLEGGGHTIAITARADVPLRIGSFVGTLPRVLFTAWDPSFGRVYHVDGVLSPQRLAPACAVLLDLPHHRLRLFPTTGAMLAWTRSTHGLAVRVPLRDDDGRLTVPVAAIGRRATWIVLDTGSAQTTFPSGYFVGLTPVGHQLRSATSGRARSLPVYPAQTIALGSVHVRDVRVATEADAHGAPAVGTDVLAGYAIAFPRGRLDHFWLVRTR